jgi:predicted CoA-binding protein
LAAAIRCTGPIRLITSKTRIAAPQSRGAAHRLRSGESLTITADPAMADDITSLRRILRECRTIAVVGLSADWFRPSYFAAKYMQQHGFRIVPVNPRYAEILGETCYPDLLAIPDPVEMVDVFRRSDDVMPIAEQAIAIGARCLWQQIGVNNLAAAELARQAGLATVIDRCVKIEHARLFGGLHWAGVNTGVISARRPV